MITTLLVSKRTFNIAKKMPIIEWKQQSLDVPQIHSPNDFEIRIVNAALNGKSLDAEFIELNVDWPSRNDIRNVAEKLLAIDDGMTDIALFIESLNIGIIIDSHVNHRQKILEANSIDILKKKVLDGD